MKHHEIEAWALRVLGVLQRGIAWEDARIELKREINDLSKMARRVAGHANSSDSPYVLWLLGVDPDGSVHGPPAADPAEFLSQLESHFDELAPQIEPLIVPWEDSAVLALLIHTDRRPFVVKNKSGGSPEREVPWRSNTSVRAARRSDLLPMLAARASLPQAEVLGADLAYRSNQSADDGKRVRRWTLSVELYLIAEEPCIIPDHYCYARLRWAGGEIQDLPRVRLSPYETVAQAMARMRGGTNQPFYTMYRGVDQLILETSGRATANAEVDDDADQIPPIPEALRGPLIMDLIVGVAAKAERLSLQLHFEPLEVEAPLIEAKWRFVAPSSA